MTHALSLAAARPLPALPVPTPPAGLAGWARTLTRPGSGIGFWAAAFSVQPGVAMGVALALALLAAALRG